MRSPSFITAHKVLPLSVLTVGIASSAAIGLLIHADTSSDAHLLFADDADEVSGRIVRELDTLSLVLRGAAGAFADPLNPTPQEWTVFTRQMQPQLTLPGVQGIGLIQIVQPEQLAAHLSVVRGWGFPDYRISPVGDRSIYTPIIFIEPFDSRNQLAFGFDAYTDPVRRAAMDAARDTGTAVLSGKLALLQETGPNAQPGTSLYFPLYHQGPGLSDAERQASLLGWTYSPLQLTDLIGGIIGELQQQRPHGVELYIYDGDVADPASLLYSSASGQLTPLSDPENHEQRSLNLYGRQWTLIFDFNESMADIDGFPAWFGFGSGLIISGLLYLFVLSVQDSRRRSQLLAEQLTVDLRAEQQRIADSEFRWKFALEAAGDGLWDWNVAAGTVYFSPRWKSMLGYADDEVTSAVTEWSSRIHPDDLQSTLKTVQDYLDGHTPHYSSEHRVRCKDGSYKWILDRGMVVERDTEGRPLRMLGTHKDITDRKQVEAALRQTQSELLEAQRIARIASWVLYSGSDKLEWTIELFHILDIDPAKDAPTLGGLQQLFTADSWQRLIPAVERARTDGTPYELELEHVRSDGSHAFMLTRGEAVRAADGSIPFLRGVVTDITERVVAARRIQQLSGLYLTLSTLNDAIVHCQTAEELLARACEVVVTHGNMALAWIGLIDNDSGAIVPRYWYGEGEDYVRGLDVSIRADLPSGQGPTGTSTRENRPVWIDDFRTDPMTRHWQQRGNRFGWLSSAALPLCQRGQPVGTLTFYSTEPNWFTAEIRSLLEEMVVNLGYALDKLAAEAESLRYEATLKEAEQRFRSLVEQSLVGAFIVQDRRFVYFNPYMETLLGYPHDGSLYNVTPGDIVSTPDRVAVQTQLDRLYAGEINHFEATFNAVRANGSTIDAGMTITAATYLQRPAIVGLIQDLSNRQVAEAQIKRYAANLENVFLQTVGMVTNLVEMRDPYTVGHEMRVAEIAVAIGQEMQLPLQQLEGLRVGGYLHDVGKVSVPSEILAKPGRITAIEYELIKGHPEAGYQILKEVEFPWPVAEIAYQHHERIDGSGYPRGLKGNEILLEARIVAVADVVESMFSHRPYRAGLGIDRALAEIEQGRGTRYDVTVADSCLRLFREKGFTLKH